MWIFCCGMERSGSTVQFQITAQLVEDAGLGKRVEWVKAEEFPKLLEKYDSYNDWKVLKSHRFNNEVCSEFQKNNAKAVYIYRDLRDVFVSMMRKNSLSFEQLWGSGFLDRCLSEFYKWTSLPGILVSKYEEMVADLPGEVERIALHLGLKSDPKKCQAIASDFTLERQLERIEKSKGKEALRQGYANGPHFDPHTNLHTNHIHSGEIGGWEGLLIAEQVALIENKTRNWLLAQGYELTLSTSSRNLRTLRYKLQKILSKESLISQ